MGRQREPGLDARSVVNAVRYVYTMPVRAGVGDRDQAVREHRALAIGIDMLPSLTDTQILRIARGQATLRGTRRLWSYHEVACAVCRGLGSTKHLTCATCGGDGFSPPVK